MRCLALVCFLMITSLGHSDCFEVSTQQVVSQEDGMSNAPLVVVNDLGRAVALWQSVEGQKESLMISFCSLNSDWSKPQTLRETKKKIKHPQLVMNANGDVVVLWVETKGGCTDLMTTSRLKSRGWTQETLLSDAKGLCSPRLAMNDEGQVISVWQQGESGEAVIVSATCREGESWSDQIFLSSGDGSAHSPQVVINETGQLRVIWEQKGAIVGISSFFGQAWTELMPVSDPSVSVLRPQIFMNRAGQAVAIWERKLGYKVSLQAAYCKPGQGWAPPSDLSSEEETVSEPRGVINDHGDALVVWRRSTAEGMNICLVSTTASGEWTGPLTLSQRGENAINPQVVLNNQEEGLVIWRRLGVGLSTIQGATLSEGMTWSLPFDFTAVPNRVGQAALSLNHQGSGVLLWRQKDEELSRIQSEVFSFGPLKRLEDLQLEQIDEIEAPFVAIDEKTEGFPIAPPEETESTETTEPIDREKEAKPIPPPEETENKETADSLEKTEGAEPLSPTEEAAQVEGEEREDYVLSPEPCLGSSICCRPNRWLFEVRGSAYRPTEMRVRKIYGEVYPAVGLLLGYAFCDRWRVVGTVDYIKRSGRSEGLRDKTNMELIPISVLLRYSYVQSSWCSMYLGVGPRYFILKTRNSPSVVDRHVTTEGIGVVGETGILFNIGSCFTIDLFVSYSYGTVSGTSNKTNIEGKSADVGGLQAGLGLGVRF